LSGRFQCSSGVRAIPVPGGYANGLGLGECDRLVSSIVWDDGFEGDFLVDAVEFDTTLIQNVATQDDLMVEDVTTVTVHLYCSDGGVADRQIEVGGDTLIRFAPDALDDGGGTADLQLQSGDDGKRDKGAI